MTLRCKVCGEMTDPGPRDNPKIIEWVCNHCIRKVLEKDDKPVD